MKTIFFGNSNISVYFLEKLKKIGFVFNLIITNSDKPMGRKNKLTSTPVKNWAIKNKINFLELEKINEDFLKKINKKKWDFFFVLSYGKILPKEILKIPKFGVLNLHPSLLPKYRGSSPIISTILDDQKKTGISIIKLNQKMDHGPILIQEKIFIKEWEKNKIIEKKFAEIGAQNFFNILNSLIKKLNKNKFSEQNHNQATFCKKYQKKDMEIKFPLIKKDARKNFLKYCAFSKPFYFDQKNKRNIITKAQWKNNNFIIEKIIPEGKKERNF